MSTKCCYCKQTENLKETGNYLRYICQECVDNRECENFCEICKRYEETNDENLCGRCQHEQEQKPYTCDECHREFDVEDGDENLCQECELEKVRTCKVCKTKFINSLQLEEGMCINCLTGGEDDYDEDIAAEIIVVDKKRKIDVV